MAITGKEKEIAAVGISVAAGCKPCTDFHVNAARKAAASDEEIERAIRIAISVRARATAVMEVYGLAHVGAATADSTPTEVGDGSRLDVLVAIGAAFGVNCVSTLEEHLDSAPAAGISAEEISVIVRLAAYIKKRAASHVERLSGMKEGTADKA